MGFIIGIDTGGTFTDSVAMDEVGVVVSAKALSTPPDFERGILASLDRLAAAIGIGLPDLLARTDAFCFGTTVATNALWTRSGSKIGLLTTKGFEDTHHIGRGVSKWAGLPEAMIKHQSVIHKPAPLLSKDCVIGITERVDWRGEVIVPLDGDEVRAAVESLAQKGVEGVAIGYLWSIKNPAHEQTTAAIVRAVCPEMYCTHSAGIVPSLGEYERFNNIIIDAYIGPVTQRFLDRLTAELAARGLGCALMTMKADGGSALVRRAVPLATIHSGPAAGVLCAQYLGEVMGHENIITTDVGGTSFDVSLVRSGRLTYTREPVLDRFSCNYPSLAVKSIGAGGGSIVRAEPLMKTLKVGPQSAGSYPGPACYGFGGREPTVTDANLILGYLNPAGLLGGTVPLDLGKAESAMCAVAEAVGLSVTATAAGVYDLVNAHCTDLIREMTVQHGYDPREFVLYAYGGCGPTHAIAWALELGCKAVVITPHASVYSAVGMAIADVTHTEYYYDAGAMPLDAGRFNRAFAVLEERLAEEFAKEKTAMAEVAVAYYVHCKYPTMYTHIRVPVERRQYAAAELDAYLPAAFDGEYERLYGRGSAYTTAGREVVGFEAQGVFRRHKPAPEPLPLTGPDPGAALRGRRRAYFRSHGDYVDTPVYAYAALVPGNLVAGAAIIEAVDTTIVIPPGQRAQLDEYRNVLVALA